MVISEVAALRALPGSDSRHDERLRKERTGLIKHHRLGNEILVWIQWADAALWVIKLNGTRPSTDPASRPRARVSAQRHKTDGIGGW